MYDWHFDDMAPGMRFESLGKTLSEAEIVDFAFQYDPQPFHIDKPNAEAGPYGGIIASGIQTIGTALRMMVQARVFAPETVLGSPGVEDLRWVQPVRPGDTIRSTGELLEVRASQSKPERGIVRYRMDVLNQRDEVVMTMTSTTFVRRAPAAAGDAA